MGSGRALTFLSSGKALLLGLVGNKHLRPVIHETNGKSEAFQPPYLLAFAPKFFEVWDIKAGRLDEISGINAKDSIRLLYAEDPYTKTVGAQELTAFSNHSAFHDQHGTHTQSRSPVIACSGDEVVSIFRDDTSHGR